MPMQFPLNHRLLTVDSRPLFRRLLKLRLAIVAAGPDLIGELLRGDEVSTTAR
jgi:hypothetical protein